MVRITLSVSQDDVFEKVSLTSEYAGSKMQGDEGSYLRVSAVDSDRDLLVRFWDESCSTVTSVFQPFLSSVDKNATSYGVTLSLSSSWEGLLRDSMQKSLFDFFVSSITAKWYKIVNRPDVESMGGDAMSQLDNLKSMLYHKKKPVRRAIS